MGLEDLMERGKRAKLEKESRESPRESSSREGTDVPHRSRDRRAVVTEHQAADPTEIEQLEEILRGNPDNHLVAEYLGFLFYSAGRYREAMARFEELLAVGYCPDKQAFHLGNCFFQLKDLDLARRYWHRCLASEPRGWVERRVRERLAEIGL